MKENKLMPSYENIIYAELRDLEAIWSKQYGKIYDCNYDFNQVRNPQKE